MVDTSIQKSELYLSLKWLHKLWISIPKVWICKALILQKLAPQNTEGFGKHLGQGYQKGDMAVLGSAQHLHCSAPQSSSKNHQCPRTTARDAGEGSSPVPGLQGQAPLWGTVIPEASQLLC